MLLFSYKICTHMQCGSVLLLFIMNLHIIHSLNRITQNCRVAEVGRELWRPPGPTSCSSRDTPSRWLLTTSRQLLEIPKGRDSTASPGSLFHHPHGEVVAQRELLCAPVCAHCPVLGLGTTEGAWLHPLCTPPSSIYIH